MGIQSSVSITGNDGAFGSTGGVVAPIVDFDATLDTTSGTTYITKVSIVIPAIDATFVIVASALVSGSNTIMDLTVRIRNTTDAATLGRAWISDTTETDNIVSPYLSQRFVQTAAAGEKNIALQYALLGLGTTSITDATITAEQE